jgi:hypothetical protein
MEQYLIVYYLCLGMTWGAWLEWFTTNRQIGPPWDMGDRFRNVVFWPIIVSVFIYYFFNNDED